MSKLTWDAVGEHFYETGVDHGVLYIPNGGVYDQGYAWNGLTKVTESPSGAEPTPLYADNIKYLNLISAEEFGATIEAYTYPDEFAQCDGTAVVNGVSIGQQARKPFGLAYRTRVGNDTEAADLGYKLHLLYGGQAAPSDREYTTINDTPEAITFSWEISTTSVQVEGLKPTSVLTVDSTKVGAAALKALEDALYGTEGSDPRLPLPDEVVAMFGASGQQEVTPTAPTYNVATHTIAVPTVAGVKYRRTDTNRVVSGNVVLETGQKVVIAATPDAGYTFPANTDDDWQFTY